MKPEDNIRKLRDNIFEELEREEEELRQRRRSYKPAQGRSGTAELNLENRGYIWARTQPRIKRRSGPNDT